MKARAAAAAAVAAALLAGCFTSEEELVGYWGAARPMPEGRYAHWPTRPDGSEWDRPSWEGEIALQRRRYVSQDPDFPHQNVRLRQLHGEVHIAQWPREDGFGYGVVFLYEDGAVAAYHMPDCADLPAPERDALAVVRDEEGFCRIDDLDQLEQALRAYLDALDGETRIDGVYRRID